MKKMKISDPYCCRTFDRSTSALHPVDTRQEQGNFSHFFNQANMEHWVHNSNLHCVGNTAANLWLPRLHMPEMSFPESQHWWSIGAYLEVPLILFSFFNEWARVSAYFIDKRGMYKTPNNRVNEYKICYSSKTKDAGELAPCLYPDGGLALDCRH